MADVFDGQYSRLGGGDILFAQVKKYLCRVWYVGIILAVDGGALFLGMKKPPK